jgi:CTP:molybdopterin cytidylyltransferase MocA
MGEPKALLREADVIPWLRRSAEVLSEGGCSAVTVVLGAEADHAATLLEHIHDIRIVIASDWVKGMRASQSGARRRTGTTHPACWCIGGPTARHCRGSTAVIGEHPGPDTLRRAPTTTAVLAIVCW